MRSGRVAFALERTAYGARALRRGLLAAPTQGGLRAAPCLRRRLSRLRRAQIHTRPPRLRQSDGDGLLGRARAVLSFTDVVHLLAHELTGLRRCRFPLT